MIDEHRRFNLVTLSGAPIEVEVNWNDSEKISNSKVLRFCIADKKYDVDIKDLTSLLVLIGDVSVKKDLIPTKITRARKLQRMLAFEWRASRPYKKGELISVHAPWIDTQTDVEDVLSGAVKKHLKEDKSIKLIEKP
jgi:hypothetical protein